MLTKNKQTKNMAKLSESIQNLIDKNDPQQKLLGMIILLLEDRLEAIEIKIDTLDKKIDKQQLINDRHVVACPHGLDNKIIDIQNEIDFIKVIKKYKILAVLLLAGVATFIQVGFEKILSLL